MPLLDTWLRVQRESEDSKRSRATALDDAIGRDSHDEGSVIMEQVLPKEEGNEVPPPIKVGIVDVLYVLCGRGFLRAASRLYQTSKAVAAVAPMGTGRQVYDAAKTGNDEQLTTYLEYWRGNNDSPEVLNWAPMVPGAAVIVTKGKAVHSQFEDSPLRAAVLHNHLKCVELLTSCAPAVDVNKGTRFSPLHFACRMNLVDIVSALLRAPGIDVNKANHAGHTALHEAADGGLVDIVRVLVAIEGIKLEPKDRGITTPYQLSCKGQHQEVAEVIGAAVEKKRALDALRDEVLVAAYRGDLDVLRSLVVKWTGHNDILDYLNEGKTPIMVAACRGHLEAVELLVSAGIDVAKTLSSGGSALKMAAQYGHVQVVKYLLTFTSIDLNKLCVDRDIDTNEVTMRTALGYATFRVYGDNDEQWERKQEVAALLRAAGAEDREEDEEDKRKRKAEEKRKKDEWEKERTRAVIKENEKAFRRRGFSYSSFGTDCSDY